MANTPTVRFKITGRQPDDAEVRDLSSMPMAKKRPSSEEVKDSVKWFAFGIIAGPIAILIGYLVLTAKRLAGIGKLVIGLGAPFAGIVLIIFAFYSLSKMFRSAQKKTAEKSARWFWVTSVMGEDVSATERFGKTEYALATMARMLPEGMNFSEKEETLWLIDFRRALADAADEASKALRTGTNLTQSSPQITFSAVEKPVSPGLVQVNASLIFNDLFSYPGNNNQNNKLLGDKLLLDIAQYYIQNGNVWFPYDLTPAYERVEEEVPAETPEA